MTLYLFHSSSLIMKGMINVLISLQLFVLEQLVTVEININIFAECPKHCSLCYNETECYECTPGYFLNGMQKCEGMFWITLRLPQCGNVI